MDREHFTSLTHYSRHVWSVTPKTYLAPKPLQLCLLF
jgi:hypothetical protein